MIYNDTQVIRECKVLSVDDNKGGGRIKVNIGREDSDWKGQVKNLPWCFPLLPKHFHIMPKVGETVLIILSRQDQTKKRRWYIGPIISQDYFLDYDSNDSFQSKSLIDNGEYVSPLKNPKFDPENQGTLIDKEDIAVQGRNNADIIFKLNEIRMRCGFKKNPYAHPKDSLHFNDENMAYIQMKHNAAIDNSIKNTGSTINIVADRINLLTYPQNTLTPFNLNDRKELITDDELTRILENAHPAVFGDELIDFLKKFIESYRVHTHPFPTLPPSLTTTDISTLTQPLENMLSKAVKIN